VSLAHEKLAKTYSEPTRAFWESGKSKNGGILFQFQPPNFLTELDMPLWSSNRLKKSNRYLTVERVAILPATDKFQKWEKK
jgi:hypothetical protein